MKTGRPITAAADRGPPTFVARSRFDSRPITPRRSSVSPRELPLPNEQQAVVLKNQRTRDRPSQRPATGKLLQDRHPHLAAAPRRRGSRGSRLNLAIGSEHGRRTGARFQPRGDKFGLAPAIRPKLSVFADTVAPRLAAASACTLPAVVRARAADEGVDPPPPPVLRNPAPRSARKLTVEVGSRTETTAAARSLNRAGAAARALRDRSGAAQGAGLVPGGASLGVRSEGPSMRMVMQWCWRRSSRASTREMNLAWWI